VVMVKSFSVSFSPKKARGDLRELSFSTQCCDECAPVAAHYQSVRAGLGDKRETRQRTRMFSFRYENQWTEEQMHHLFYDRDITARNLPIAHLHLAEHQGRLVQRRVCLHATHLGTGYTATRGPLLI